MNRGQLADLLINRAKEFSKEANAHVQRNRHMNDIKEGELINQDQIDAILVGFVNFCGEQMCMDIALYTKDLNKDGQEG